MSEYVSVYKSGAAPSVYKREKISAEETLSSKVMPVNMSYEEFCNIPEDVVRLHMDNLTDYIKTTSNLLSLIDPEGSSSEGWPLSGWQKIQESNTELIDWWSSFQLRKINEKEQAELAEIESANSESK